MKKLKIFTAFIIIFLIVASSSYAFQIQQDNLASNSVNVNNSNFKIKYIELTKSSNEKGNEKSLTLSEKCTINEVTVIDSIYGREEESESLITDVSTSPISAQSVDTIDLSMNSLTAPTQPFEVGEEANIHFTIANYGPNNAINTNVRVDVDGSQVGSIPMGTILAGYQYNAEFDLTGPSEGTHEIKLIAQVGYGLTDTNLNNNTIIRSFVWKGIPDLVAKSFETVSTYLHTGEDIEFRFRVANEGTGKAVGTINNHLSINGQAIAVIPITDLDAGYTATITFTLTFNEPETYYMLMDVNKNATIVESNYSNNSKFNSVTIEPTVLLDVPEYTQQPYDSICWATSAAMVISYFSDDLYNRNIDIATTEFGENFNQGIYNIGIMEDYVEDYTGVNGSVQNNALSYTAVQYQTDNDGPIITVIDWDEVDGRHAEVITGYNVPTNSVIYIDPWDGESYMLAYTSYLSNDDWDWTSSIFWN